MKAAMQSLGDFQQTRRLRLDPVTFGFISNRRRTSGLLREEILQLANISPTWYTCIKQGHGGAPSREVLIRIASGLCLTSPERVHLFMLAFGHSPDTQFTVSVDISPRLKRVLDAFSIPAIIKTVTWDVIAWKRATACVFTDYSQLPLAERNVLRWLFTDPVMRRAQHDWQAIALLVVNALRTDAARVGMSTETEILITELYRLSPEVDDWWRSNGIASHGEAIKRICYRVLGTTDLELFTFTVEGRQDLAMLIFNPSNEVDHRKIREQAR